MGLITHKVKQYDNKSGTLYHYVDDFTTLGWVLVLALFAFLWHFGWDILRAIVAALTSAAFSVIVLVILRCALRVLSEGAAQLVPCVRPRRRQALPLGGTRAERAPLWEAQAGGAVYRELRALLHWSVHQLPEVMALA